MGKKHSGPNKHGLKRYIEAPIRQQIRKDAGYGCVICGSLFCDYEHIEPEFHEAQEHNPEKMTLLCEACHGKVTGKRKSKRRVWTAKAKPYCKQHGIVQEEIEPCTRPTFELGNSLAHDVEIILLVHGKPLMWLESPDDDEEPFKVNAIFHDHKGEFVACLNRNQFTSVVGSHDVWGEGTCIEIRPQKGVIGLTLNIEGDKPVKIERINMSYLGTSLRVDKNGYIQLDGNNTIGRLQVESGHTALCMGRTPTTRLQQHRSCGVYPLLSLAYFIARRGKPIITINGFHMGWILGGFLLNKNYLLVGYHEEGTTYTITGEYIGQLIQHVNNQYLLANPQSEYESYEPIWVSSFDKATKNIRIDSYVDVTHRVFDTLPMRRPARPQKANNPVSIPSQAYELVTDPVKNGDKVVIDFQGKVDGIPFEGGTASDFSLQMGQGRMIAGFEEGIVGRKSGESFDIEVKFPDDYHAENLRRKPAVFSITLKRVERVKSTEPETGKA